MIKFFRKNISCLVILILLVAGFFIRIKGLKNNYSFWTDEASTARFSRGFLETGISQIPLTGLKEGTYFTTVYLTALSFKMFGQNEFAARLPEVIFGVFLILVVYWTGRTVFDDLTGLGASVFTTFSYFLISWSRQARGYMILAVFSLLALGFIYKFSLNGKVKYLILSIIFLFLSCITHTLGFNLIPIFFVYLLLTGNLKKIFKNKYLLILFFFAIILLLFFTNFKQIILVMLKSSTAKVLKKEIYFSYFHSLFWRQYPLFSFLSVFSLLTMYFNKTKEKSNQLYFFLAIIGVYFFSSIFLLSVPFEKYVIFLFPIFFILSSYALRALSKIVFKEKEIPVFIFFVVFLVINGNKLTFKPKNFYSMNFDMREIPEVDYKGLYQLIQSKSTVAGLKEMVIIDIDEDIPAWYLGEGMNGYVPRKDVDEKYEKSMMTGYRYLHSLEDFENVYKNSPYGFLVLLEHNFRFYPDGLVDYARKNLNLEKKENVANFSPDWNYWPVELYSWGFNKNIPK